MSIIRKFLTTFKRTKDAGYSTIYVVVDIHETILKPTWKKEELYQFYPNARKCLQMMSESERFKLILWSSCTQEKLIQYQRDFLDRDIKFDFINSNPDAHNNDYACFDSKFYFDVAFDDKFGFSPYVDWFFIRLILSIKRLFGKI